MTKKEKEQQQQQQEQTPVAATNGNGKRGRPKGYKPFVPALSSQIELYKAKVQRQLTKADWACICKEIENFWKKVSNEEPPKCFLIAMDMKPPKDIDESIKRTEERLKKLREMQEMQKKLKK